MKGQEWPHVVVHLADADQYPHRLADDVEEERRLFHVAITRASGHVTIVTGAHPSPFVAELTTEPSAGRVVSSHRPEPTSKPSTRTTSTGDDPAADLDADGQRRFAALRDLRNDLRDGKPAYVVFDNKTLAAIARTAPTTLRELGRISGVGPAKLERYGNAVIELIADMSAGLRLALIGRGAAAAQSSVAGYGEGCEWCVGESPSARASALAREDARLDVLRGDSRRDRADCHG